MKDEDWTEEMMRMLGTMTDSEFADLYHLNRDIVSYWRGKFGIIAWGQKKKHIFIHGNEHKECCTCKEIKPLDEFYKSNNNWDRLSKRCKQCNNDRVMNSYRKESSELHISDIEFNNFTDLQLSIKYNVSNKSISTLRKSRGIKSNKIRIRHKITNGIEYKYCSSCDSWLYLDTFYTDKRKWDGLYSICSACFKKHNQKPERKKKINEYSNNKYKNDVLVRIHSGIRKNIKEMLSGKKKDKTGDIIGCSIDYFKRHLESLFTDEMTWDNYGEYWHIEHIIPKSLFDVSNDNQLMLCWNFRNMKPMEKISNLRKGDFLSDGSKARYFSGDVLEYVKSNYPELFYSVLGTNHDPSL